jgi:uncharacterized protein (DUF2164 family)
MLIPIKLPKEQKDEIIERLIAFYDEERSESIGHLGAEQLLDFMIKEIGPFIYNKAMEDARTVVLQKASEIEDELYAMEKPIKMGRKT